MVVEEEEEEEEFVDWIYIPEMLRNLLGQALAVPSMLMTTSFVEVDSTEDDV